MTASSGIQILVGAGIGLVGGLVLAGIGGAVVGLLLGGALGAAAAFAELRTSVTISPGSNALTRASAFSALSAVSTS